MNAALLVGEVQALPKRSITEDTCRFWNYRRGKDKSATVQIANYCDDNGEIVAQKIRSAGKHFKIIGDAKQMTLYGQHLWRDGGKMLVITEGEIDALSVSQLQGNKWPVVSVPNGAQSADKAVAKQIEWVEKFDSVVIMFDDDEPGRKASVEVAKLLTPGKAKIARIPGYKDANEALVAGDGPKVIDAMWSAKCWRPDGVVEVDTLMDKVSDDPVMGVSWPWPQLTAATYGIRTKEMYVLGAGVGIGKSDVFVKDTALSLILQGHKVGMVCLEETPAHTVKMLTGKIVGKRLHVPGIKATEGELKKSANVLNGKLMLFDHYGAMDFDTIKSKIRYMAQSFGAKYIFLDNLTALAAAIEGESERIAIDKMMAEMAGLIQQLDIALFLVSHLTTPDGTAHEEGGRVLEKHFTGSRAIARWANFMFALERDKQDRDCPTTFRVLKDRFTGDSTGLTFTLKYDRKTGRSSECPLGDDHGFQPETEAAGEF